MSIGEALPLADGWGMHGDIGSGWWIVMMVGMTLFWGAIILGAFAVFRGALRGSPERRDETATEILDRRFAEGTISLEDYELRRNKLSAREPRDEGERADLGPPPAAAGSA